VILQNSGNVEHQDSVINVDANVGDDNIEPVIVEEKVTSY